MTKEQNTHSDRSLLSKMRAYLIAGLLVTAPITITLWLTVAIIGFVDKRVSSLFPPQYSDYTSPLSIPGLGLVIVIGFLLLVGMLATNFLGRYFIRLGESILDRLPVIRSLYGATKQIFETVFASQSQAFRDVVMIEYPRKGIWCLGFLTGTTKGEVQQLTDDEVVNIFLPTTPNPTSGFLLFVPRKDIKVLDMTVEEGIKLVVSAGIVTPDKLQKMQNDNKDYK